MPEGLKARKLLHGKRGDELQQLTSHGRPFSQSDQILCQGRCRSVVKATGVLQERVTESLLHNRQVVGNLDV
jgi:hypothetical protein